MARYSDIRRGGELKYALDNWVKHMSDYESRESNIGQGKERGPQSRVYVTPFGEDIEANELVGTNATTEHLNVLYDHITAVSSTEVVKPNADGEVSGKELIDIPGFRAAKVVWFRNTAKTKTVVTSKVTKLKYLKYAGDRYSCPFGKATANDDQNDAFKALKSRLTGQSGFAVNRVSLIREKFAAS